MEIIVDNDTIKKDIREVKIVSKNGTSLVLLENPDGDLVLRR